MAEMNAAPGRDSILDDEDGLDLREMLGIVLENWLWVVLALAIATVVGLYAAYTAPPVYRAQALIKVERQQSLFEGTSPLLAQQPQGSAEVEILKSRSVLAAAAEQVGLTVQAHPDHLGSLGAAMARGCQGSEPAQPPLQWLPFLPTSWLNAYAWGGESIQLDRLEVPEALVGTSLRLTAGPGGRYSLSTPAGTHILEGRVGEPASGEIDAGKVRLFVASLVARPGTEFSVVRRPASAVAASMRGRLGVTETGQRSGVLDVTYTATSAASAQTQLKAITETYLQQNVERQSQEAQKTLAFLKEQLPELKKEVDAAQSKLSDYQEQEGSIDLSMEAQGLLGQVSDIERKLSELELKESELLQEYTPEHPTVQSVRRSRAQLQEERRKLEKQLKQLPEREAKFLELSRDAEVANELYVQLLNRSQELEVTKAGTTASVHIVDAAYAPPTPTGPERMRILLIAILVGVLLGVGLAFLRNALRLRIRDPETIEQRSGLPLYATIPHSREQRRLTNARRRKHLLLADGEGDDVAVEALRSLRTSLQFALLEAGSPVVAITSPTPSAGKSFVAANLARLISDLDKRVLLIDADMRRGHIHRQLGVDRQPGLSDIIAGQASLAEAVHRRNEGRLNFVASGTIPPNPSELLLNVRFAEFLKEAENDFDLVLIDTPPVLSVTDATIVAQHAGVNFLVARYNHTGMHEIETAAKRIRQTGGNLQGVIFNDYRPGVSRYAYGKYGYATYRYKGASSATGK